MRLYESVYIFDAALDEAAINKKLERYHELVTGKDKKEEPAAASTQEQDACATALAAIGR